VYRKFDPEQFRPKTFRHHQTGAEVSGHFGTSAELSSSRRQFGTGAEMSQIVLFHIAITYGIYLSGGSGQATQMVGTLVLYW